jgi:hypothetical protein
MHKHEKKHRKAREYAVSLAAERLQTNTETAGKHGTSGHALIQGSIELLTSCSHVNSTQYDTTKVTPCNFSTLQNGLCCSPMVNHDGQAPCRSQRRVDEAVIHGLLYYLQVCDCLQVEIGAEAPVSTFQITGMRM